MSSHDKFLQDLVDRFFREYDKDNSGSLDIKQFVTFFNQTAQHAGIQDNINWEQASNVIKQFDTNHDQKLSKQEMLNLLKQFTAE